MNMPSKLAGEKVKGFVTVEIELEVSGSDAIASAIDHLRRHFSPRDLGFGSGREGWYSLRSTSYDFEQT